MGSIQRVVFGGFAALSLSCAAEAPTDLGSDSLGESVQPIIYGYDDRRELYEVDDAVLRELGRSSVAAMIDGKLLYRPSSGGVRVVSGTLKQTYKLCDGERFENQPATATCSGVLIDRDLLLTAGHCIESEKDCKANSFVFDYAYRSEGELEAVSASDVYGCRRIVARTFTETGPDYAIVQLDRVPTGREPVEIRTDALQDGDALAVLGFTSGLPMKVDLAATVKDARASSMDYFGLNSDTYEGSSGSAILDANYALAGVLVRGGEDYVQTPQGCFVSKVYTSERITPPWRWEQATYVAGAISDLCDEQGYPSERLCGIKPSCGDGFCSFDPVDQGCVEDCAAACSHGDCTKGGQGGSEPGVPLLPSEPDVTASSKGGGSKCSVAPGLVGNSAAGVGFGWVALAYLLAARRTRRR